MGEFTVEQLLANAKAYRAGDDQVTIVRMTFGGRPVVMLIGIDASARTVDRLIEDLGERLCVDPRTEKVA